MSFEISQHKRLCFDKFCLSNFLAGQPSRT